MFRSNVWSFAAATALLCSLAASVPGYAHAQVALKFAVEGLDLDTGTVTAGRAAFEEVPETDLMVAYNSEATPHAVLEGNERFGVQLAFTDEAFESVTSDDLAGLSFARTVERPFGGSGTFVVRTAAGAHFKLGNVVESEGGVSFDTAQLSAGGGSAGVLSGSSSRTALPPGVTPAEWQAITRQILGVPEIYGITTTALAYGLCALVFAAALAGLGLRLRGRPATRPFKWSFAGVLALAGASVAYAAPVLFEFAAIRATQGEANDQFGQAIAATDDTLVVGALLADNGTLIDAGAAYVFNRDAAGNWVQQARLVPSDPITLGNFGAAVAIEGDTLVVGAPSSGNTGLLQNGAAYVFTRNAAGVWVQTQKLVAADGAPLDLFGSVLALSGDILMVAATMDDHANAPGTLPPVMPDVGSVYVFKRNGSVWAPLQNKLLPPLPFMQFDRFGARIALDGTIAVINSSQSTRDGFFVYEREDFGNLPFLLSTRLNTLLQQVPNLNAMLVLDGDRLAIGAAFHDRLADGSLLGDSGAVAIYERVSAQSWTLSAKLWASNPTQSGRFGTAIAMRGDTIVASKGYTRGSLPVTPAGEGYVFTRRADGVWTEDARLQPTTPIFEESFGTAVALAGESALVSAPGPTRCTPAPCTLPSGTVYEYVVVAPHDPPELTVPADQTVEAESPAGAIVSFAASAIDAVDGPVETTCTPASGSTFALGTTVVTCTASDSEGNSASASFTVQVVDTTDPDAQCNNVVAECTGEAPTLVDASCTGTDAVDTSLELQTNVLASYPVGSHQYFCSARDDSNNVGHETCSVVVQDTTPPVCTPPEEMGIIYCTDPGGVSRGQAFVAQHLSEFEFSDTCDFAGTSIEGPLFLPSGCAEGLISTITIHITDAADNESSCSTDILVFDNNGPFLTVPAPAQAECNVTGGVPGDDANVASWLAGTTAEDDCHDEAWTHDGPALYGLGITTVRFTAEDSCGNWNDRISRFTVVDTTPPAVACQDVAVECTGALTPVTTSCSALDVCDAAPALASDAAASYALGSHGYTCESADGSGNGALASCQVTVVDTTAPVLSGVTTVTAPIQIATTFQASAHFTDACGPHTGTFDWGDGTTSAATISEGAGQGDAAASHAYAVPGMYTVTLTLSDASGNTSTSVSLQDVIVAHPDGFVTGAGMIASPAGAYAPDPALTGTVQFNFKALYQNGSTVPTGHTEFRFRAADLEFDSTSYAWLVVTSGNVRYTGTGTLNGVAGYSFMLTATDAGNTGHNDKFRMRIWSGSQAPIYDNQRGAPADAAATQLIANGNINIH